MAHDGRHGNGGDGPTPEEALERTLRALGPLLRRRAQAGVPRRAFVIDLRARLLAEVTRAPEPRGVHRRSSSFLPVPEGPRARPGDLSRRRWAIGLMVTAVVLAALAAGTVALGWRELALIVLVALVPVALQVGRRGR